MCLGVPMKIVEIKYPMGVAEAKGVRRSVSLQLLKEDEINVGDYVIVHVGYAIEKVDKEFAESTWELFEEMIEKET